MVHDFKRDLCQVAEAAAIPRNTNTLFYKAKYFFPFFLEI